MDEVWRSEGRIDVVVNCAGYGVAGPIEDTPVAMAQAQFNTNVFGVTARLPARAAADAPPARRTDRERDVDCR